MINSNHYPKEFSKCFCANYSKKFAHRKAKLLSPCVSHCTKMKFSIKDFFSKFFVQCLLSEKWRDLTWPRKIPKFNLHHQQEIPMVFKMAVLTPKSGVAPVIWGRFQSSPKLLAILFHFSSVSGDFR